MPASIDTFEFTRPTAHPALRHPLSRQLESAQFKRVYHRNQWPSPGYFRGVTGAIPEHRVWLSTQKAQPLATVCNSLAAHAAAHWVAVPLLACALVCSGIFGMRKGLHQSVSNWRALRTAQRPMPPEFVLPSSEALQFERACGLKALEKLRRQERWRARVGMLTVGGLAPLAATMTTVDIFFKQPILGHLVPALGAAAHPLAVASLPFLAGSAFLAGAFDLFGVWRMGALHQRLNEATLAPWMGLEDAVLDMARQRMVEVRKYGLYAGVASMGVALGAPLTFAFGPAGLSVLLPSILATIWIAYERANRTEYKATLSDEQKLALGNRHDVCNEVMRAHEHYAALKALKAERRTYYPYAGDAPAGYATRLWAYTRRSWWAPPDRPRWETARESVLGYWRAHLDIETAFERRRLILAQQELAEAVEADRLAELEAQQADALRMIREDDGMREVVQDIDSGAPSVAEIIDHLHALMQDTGLLHAFGAELLGDKALRAVFDGCGFAHERRDWWVEPERIEDTVERQLDPETQRLVLERYWCHAERVLLKRGKRRYRDRERELLDYLTVMMDVANCGK